MKTVFLDLGNVVAFFDHRRASRQLAALASPPMTEADVFARVFESPLEPDLDCGRIQTPEFLALLRTHLGLSASDDAIAAAWCDIFRPNDDLIAQLPVLRKVAHRLVLASNTNELHVQQIARQFAGPLAYFDATVLSCRVGARKPEPAFFLRCLEVADRPAAECVFVDDKPAFVEAGAEAGMSGIVYRPGLDLVAAVTELSGADTS